MDKQINYIFSFTYYIFTYYTYNYILHIYRKLDFTSGLGCSKPDPAKPGLARVLFQFCIFFFDEVFCLYACIPFPSVSSFNNNLTLSSDFFLYKKVKFSVNFKSWVSVNLLSKNSALYASGDFRPIFLIRRALSI